MRPATLGTTVIVAAAIAITGCSAHPTATHPSPAPNPKDHSTAGPAPTPRHRLGLDPTRRR